MQEDGIDYSRIKVDEEPRWSQTSLKIIDLCPKQYFFSRVLRIQRIAAPEMIRGTILHNLIENFWKIEKGVYVPIPRYKTEDAFAGVSRARVANTRREAYKTGRTRDGLVDKRVLGILWSKSFVEETEEMARLIYRRYTKEDEKERVRNGKRRVELNLLGEILFEGKRIEYETKIDELLPSYENSTLILRDHKTGYIKMPREFVDHDLQFSFYAFALWNELTNENSPLREDYPCLANKSLEEFLESLEIQVHHIPPVLTMRRKNFAEYEIPKESVFIPTRRSPQQILDLFKTILDKKELLKKRAFNPTTNTSICAYRCGYNHFCRSTNPEEILREAQRVQEERQIEENSLFNWAGICINSSMREKKPKSPRQERQRVMRLMKKNNELIF